MNSPADLPERPDISETIFVLGTGIAGSTAGWVLSEAGYKIVFIEQLDAAFSGTSIGALGIHLGGRYFKDPVTAVQCLESGIKFKRLMSFAFSSKRLRFLVARDSPISLDAYIKFYRDMRGTYATLSDSDHLFGPPETFFRVLRSNELAAFNDISGGIETQERCFAMDRVRSVLTGTLRARGAQFLTSRQVINIDKTQVKGGGSGFRIATKNLCTGQVEFFTSRYVVNATGFSARLLGQRLGHMPQCRLDLRFFHDVRISKKAQSRYPFPFVVIPGYMHYIPLGDRISSLVGFKETLETLHVGSGEKLILPKSWQEQLLKRRVVEGYQRSAEIISTARDRFMPQLGRAVTHAVYPGVAVSFDPEQHIKRQARIERLPELPGYFVMAPTKASHSITLALEILRHVIADSLRAGVISSASPYTVDILDERNIGYIG
jgi:glycine/D-amino acid oxidase-like deaminating enzyme